MVLKLRMKPCNFQKGNENFENGQQLDKEVNPNARSPWSFHNQVSTLRVSFHDALVIIIYTLCVVINTTIQQEATDIEPCFFLLHGQLVTKFQHLRSLSIMLL